MPDTEYTFYNHHHRFLPAQSAGRIFFVYLCKGIGHTTAITDCTMEKNIISVATIDEYHRLLGIETLNPLVSVIDLSEARPLRHFKTLMGFYAIFLKDVKCGDLIYGRQHYDYQAGTVVCLAPGQIIGKEDNGEVFQPKGWALLFHPDLLHGTSLGRNMREYRFFAYESNEALHLSDRERTIVVDCLKKIQDEIQHDIDRMSRRIITKGIEMLLDYCLRFYERQFITRENVNSDILTRFENLLDDYFADSKARQQGLPTVKYCATELCLSPNYFGDLIKKETGHTAQDYIQAKVMNFAKERVLDPTKSISQISYDLGFQYPQHFTRMFKKSVGLTPSKYRTQVSGK